MTARESFCLLRSTPILFTNLCLYPSYHPNMWSAKRRAYGIFITKKKPQEVDKLIKQKDYTRYAGKFLDGENYASFEIAHKWDKYITPRLYFGDKKTDVVYQWDTTQGADTSLVIRDIIQQPIAVYGDTFFGTCSPQIPEEYRKNLNPKIKSLLECSDESDNRSWSRIRWNNRTQALHREPFFLDYKIAPYFQNGRRINWFLAYILIGRTYRNPASAPYAGFPGHRFPEEKLPEAGSGVPPGKSRGGAFTASAPRNLTVIR